MSKAPASSPKKEIGQKLIDNLELALKHHEKKEEIIKAVKKELGIKDSGQLGMLATVTLKTTFGYSKKTAREHIAELMKKHEMNFSELHFKQRALLVESVEELMSDLGIKKN